jgi:hypothetical protein
MVVPSDHAALSDVKHHGRQINPGGDVCNVVVCADLVVSAIPAIRPIPDLRQNRVVLTPVAGAKSAEACRAQPGSGKLSDPKSV